MTPSRQLTKVPSNLLTYLHLLLNSLRLNSSLRLSSLQLNSNPLQPSPMP